MNKTKLSMIAAILALVLASLACSFDFSSANIEDAWMAFDKEGILRTTTYNQDQVFYAIVDVKNAPDDTSTKAVFIAVNAEGVEANTQIHEQELVAGDGQHSFELSNENLWPVGTYKTEIYLNDELDRTLEFEVQGSAAPAPEPTATEPSAPPPGTAPSITSAYTSSDEAGANPTTVYGPADIFYCKVTLANAPADTLISAIWYAVNAEGIEPNSLIDSAEITGGDDIYTFDLTGEQLWPAGTYKVELYLNNAIQTALEFQVVGEAPAPSGPSLTKAFLARDEDGVDATTIFTVNDVFYLIAEVEGTTVDDTVQAYWYAVNAQGVDPNTQIGVIETTGGATTYTLHLFNDSPWPLGTYRVDLYISGALLVSLEFIVQ